jgi:fluoride exporter
MSGSDLGLAFLGGGIGSLARWLIGLFVGRRYNGDFPLATFLINVSGAFLIGFLAVLFSLEWTDRFGHLVNTMVLTGILGGFTTFSSMNLDTSKLLHGQKTGLALVYLFATVAYGLLAAILGGALAWRLL